MTTSYSKPPKGLDENSKGNYIPLPIQSFLLTQTNSFFLNKNTRDNACISLERVLVQNIIHGLSPTICSAIQMVSRWQLIKIAFPHIMHCASLLLREKFCLDNSKAPFSSTETKIMYTLHWIIMDAASECEDNDKENKCSEGINYLHDLSSIQLFIYLFAPLIHQMDESVFQTLKLENGLNIWTPLRNYQQPELQCFTAPVKSKIRKNESSSRQMEPIGVKNAQIYIGKGSSVEKLAMDTKDRASFVNGAFCPANILYPEESIDSEMTTSFGGTSLLDCSSKNHWVKSTIYGGDNLIGLPNLNQCKLSPAPLARLSDICPLSTVSGDTLNLEVFCENCNSVVSNKSGELIGCSCYPLSMGLPTSKRNSWSLLHRKLGKLNFPIDWDYKNKIINETAACTQQMPPQEDDFLLATHLDLAVLRCLFCPRWSEAGVFWGLRYLHKRLLEISLELRMSEEQEKRLQNSFKRRSHSLTCMKASIPDSFWQTPISWKSDFEFGLNAAMSTCSSESTSRHLVSQDPSSDLSASFPASVWDRSMSISTMSIRPSKKMKMTDFKERFTKISKTKKADTDRGDDDGADSSSRGRSLALSPMGSGVYGVRIPHSPRQQRVAKTHDESAIPEELLDSGSDKDERRNSLPSDKLGSKMSPVYTEAEALLPAKKSRKTVTHKRQNGTKFKPITSKLRNSRFADGSGCHENPIVQPEIQINSELDGVSAPPPSQSQLPPQPFFNLPDDPATALDPLPEPNTAHDRDYAFDEATPTACCDVLVVTKKTTSFFDDSPKQEKAAAEAGALQRSADYARKAVLHRCPSDTEINYQLIEELEEVAGSVHYIQSGGQMNYHVVLKALHSLASAHSSIRVCEFIMKNMACLFDMGVFERRFRRRRPAPESEGLPAAIGSKKRAQSRQRRGRSNRQSPLVPPRVDAQRSSLGSSLQIAGGGGGGGGTSSVIGRRDRRVSMMISNGSYPAPMKDYSGPSQSDEDVSDESRSKSVPPPRPSKVDRLFCAGGTRPKTEKTNASEESDNGTLSNNDIAMEIIIKVVKVLGCCHEHLCQSQPREKRAWPPDTDPNITRLQTHECLLKLYRMHLRKFQNFLSKMAAEQPLQEIVEFLHAYTGFCNDPASKRRAGHNSRNGYKNCFNQSVTGEGTRNSEGVLVASMLEPLAQRLVASRKDLICQENFVLYSDIRQLLAYFKEVHGSTFRRVMLTGLLRIWRRPRRNRAARAGKVQIFEPHLMRSGQSFHYENEYHATRSSSDLHNRTNSLSVALATSELLQQMAANTPSYKAGKKNIFKRYSSAVHSSVSDANSLPVHMPIYRRGKKRESLCSQTYQIANDVKDVDDSNGETVMDSITVVDSRSRARSPLCEYDPAAPSTPMKTGMGEQDGGGGGGGGGSSANPPSPNQNPATSAGQTATSKCRAAARNAVRTKDVREASSDASPSASLNTLPKLKDKKFIDAFALKKGMAIFSLMLDSFDPGMVPESQLVASMLDLEAPVLARACLLLELANFVTRCNKGEWPCWMRFSFPGVYRHSSTTPLSGSYQMNNTSKKTNFMQRQAGQMFHGWAEALGTRLEYFLKIEQAADRFSNISEIQDETKMRELQILDEEENFLDDSTVNPNGDSCPYALKSVVVQLLLAITTYLRETHQFLPKYRGGLPHKETYYDRASHLDISQDHRRVPGDISYRTTSPTQAVELHSPISDDQDSVESILGDIGQLNTEVHPPAGNRRISFAFIQERSASFHSSTNSLDQTDGSSSKERRGRKSVGGKNLLRKRRGSGSFQRTNTVTRIIKPETVGSIRGLSNAHTRIGSIRCRKESAQSQISTCVPEISSAKESDEIIPNYYQPSRLLKQNELDNYSIHMPWMRVITQFANKTNFVCNHVDFCHPDCYERQQRQCQRLLNAVKTVYSCDLLKRRRRDCKSSVVTGHRDSTDNGDSSINSEEEGPHSASLGGSLAAALSHSVGERGSCDTDIDASMQLLLHRAVSESDEKKLSLFTRSRRKESIFGNHSPHRRKDSVPLFDKFLKSRTTAVANSDELGLSFNIGDRGEPPTSKQRLLSREKPVDHPILRYLENHVFNLTHNCFNIINKGALLLNDDMFADIMPVAWELLLENDPELVASAANVVILAAIKIPTLAQQLIFRELQHEDVNQRMAALLRVRSLWCSRFQFWQRLEESAPNQLKLPPPYIEFVLPSPTLGHPGSDVPDPSWSIRKGQSAEEVQLKQNEAAKTFVTASTTRRKQQQEMLEKAVNAEEQRRKSARQQFHLTTCSILDKSSLEVAFNKEHKDELGLEDGGNQPGPIQEEFNAAVRRLSVAPINRNLNVQARNLSWRHGSISFLRANLVCHEDDDNGSYLTAPVVSNQPLQYAQCVFPSSLCAASIPIIHLLDDGDVNTDGVAVATIAEHVVWQCLVEDTTLFLRYILERLTRVTEKDELLYVLRKLIQRLPELPTQSAHALFNNLVGYIMFYVRTPSISAPESIAGALSLLWQIVPFVQNIYFKDLKQILRKEQVDPTLMVTANLPCAKQFNVFDEDVFVAQLVRLQDETKDYRFTEILKEALQDSNIPERDHHLYSLCDDRSNIIRNSSHYVRDFYFFKRNHTPKLRLKKLTPEDGNNLLQKNAFNLKFLEIGKVMFSYSILKHTPANQNNNHVYFLHDELTKHPSFPRKALESEFSLYENGSLGKQLYGMDMLHKISWCRLVSLLFERMPSSFPWTSDIHLFLNIFNGVLILHADDTAMLRICLAGYIQASQHFKMIFSVNGYLVIMPTILRVYSKNLHNLVLKKAIQFMCKQFYILHRTPFILQMFGSISNYIDFQGDESNFYKVKPYIIYDILRAISTDLTDNLNILQLVSCSKPLKALDFCYENENDSWSVLEAVTLCVTVIVYAPDSGRAKQMMIILQAILPLILNDLHNICLPPDAIGNAENCRKIEAQAIQQLAVSIKQLICTCDYLTRQSDKPFGKTGDEKCSFRIGGNFSQTQNSVVLDDQDESPYRLLEEGRFRKNTVVSNMCDEPQGTGASSRHNVSAIAPHEAVLQVSCDFYTSCHNRLNEMGEKHKAVEPLDQKSIMRLSELAQSIIKQIPNDVNLLRSKALQRFFLEIPPFVDWDHESMKSCKALENLIYRLNRTMNKILKDNLSRRNLDWDSMTNLIKAVFLIVKRNKSVAYMKDVRQLMDYLKKFILLDSSPYAMNESLSSVQFSGRQEQTSPNHMAAAGAGGDNSYLAPQSPNGIPAKFSSMVIKFFALMLQSLEGTYKLKDFCERFDQRFGNTEAILINYMENVIIPLLLRCGGGRKDSIQMSDENIYFIFDIILSSLNPIIHSGYQASRVTHPVASNQTCQASTNKGYLTTGTQSSARFIMATTVPINTGEYMGGLASLVGLSANTNKPYQHLHVGDANQIRSSSLSHSEKSLKYGNDYLYRLSFLALKVAMICYPRHSLIQSRSISSVISDLGFKKQGGIHLWKFLDFIVTKRTPIFLLLIPFLRFKASQIKCETQGEQAFQQVINQKFVGLHLPSPKSDAAYLKELALDLRQIKDELTGYYSQTQFQSAATVTLDPHLHKSSIRNIIPSFTNESLTNSSICNQSVQGSVGFANAKDTSRTTYIVRTAISRNSSRRISAREGGNIICRYQQVQNPHRSDAILTVSSVDSLPSQATMEEDAPAKKYSGRLTRGETRNKKSMKLHWKQRPGSMVTGKSGALVPERQTVKQSMATGMATPVGSALAAAQAAQLYGSAAPYLRESLTRSRPEELIEMKGVPSFPIDETESSLSEPSMLKRSHNLYRSRSEETEETNLSPRNSLIPSLDSRHKVVTIEAAYASDKATSEEALLTSCGAGVTLAESESSNASVTEYSSLIKLKPPKE